MKKNKTKQKVVNLKKNIKKKTKQKKVTKFINLGGNQKNNEIKEIKSKFELQIEQDNQEYYNKLFENINLNQEYLYEPHDKQKYDMYSNLNKL